MSPPKDPAARGSGRGVTCPVTQPGGTELPFSPAPAPFKAESHFLSKWPHTRRQSHSQAQPRGRAVARGQDLIRPRLELQVDTWSPSRADTKASPKQPSSLVEHNCLLWVAWRRRGSGGLGSQHSQSCVPLARAHFPTQRRRCRSPAFVPPVGLTWTRWAQTGWDINPHPLPHHQANAT